MSRSMIQAAVTMGQLQQKLDVIGNNLANSNTPGYKTRNAEFSSLLMQQINNLDEKNTSVPRMTPEGIRSGSGAKLGAVTVDLTKGTLQTTERSLDAALLTDNHMFQVEVPTDEGTEVRYTRAGNFYLNPIGGNQLMLTDSNGAPVLGENGRIVLEDGFNGLTIAENGTIIVDREEGQSVEGRLGIVEAVRPRILEASENNTFRLPAEDELNLEANEIIQAVAADDVHIQTGALESSNVDMQKQMTNMLMVQRAYQFNGQSISLSDQMSGLVNQLRS
ncbi:flagellar hook-basal body protein [Thalassobacillus devorans]|uniref:flagellar hook-basal body protein n=1 Tax=Thalassobacillus devorans TaxID=279813 RepID=UPI000A1CA928|nr:flagellar hook-basal body protein [Thalassobacillus devorans]